MRILIAGFAILMVTCMSGCSGDSSASKKEEDAYKDRNPGDIHPPPTGPGQTGPPPGATAPPGK
jgi:uncharacterized lipoprotein